MEAITEIKKIWDKFSSAKSWEDFSLDISVYQKMFYAFQPGPSYYWLLNAGTANFEMVSPEIEKVLGYSPSEITFAFLLGKVHPDDVPYLLNFEITVANFFSELPASRKSDYKIQYDFRLQKANGEYTRILNQMIMVQYSSNNIYTFGVQADISHLKKDLRPVLSFIALNYYDPSFFDVAAKKIFEPSKSLFSKREKEILEYMLQGKISKEIAQELNISKYTVDTHRKHLLQKTESKSVSEMVQKAIVNGWI